MGAGKKTIVVTGANRGIGLEFCRQFMESGHRVIALCRKASSELRKLDVEVVEGFDAASDGSVEKTISSLKDRLKDGVDLLVNNAGIMEKTPLGQLDMESILRQINVNSLGPLRVTHGFLRYLKPGSKVALITSLMGSIADNGSGGAYGYRMSKTALNSAGVSLAHDLKPKEIAVALLHPGYVKTDMTGNTGNLTPEASVRGLIQRIDGLNLENSGTFWHSDGRVLPW